MYFYPQKSLAIAPHYKLYMRTLPAVIQEMAACWVLTVTTPRL